MSDYGTDCHYREFVISELDWRDMDACLLLPPIPCALVTSLSLWIRSSLIMHYFTIWSSRYLKLVFVYIHGDLEIDHVLIMANLL